MQPTIGNRGSDPRYEPVLDELMSGAPAIQGAILATLDGLVLSHRLPDSTDPLHLAALTATLSGFVMATAEEATLGEPIAGVIHASGGDVHAVNLLDEIVLGLLTAPGTDAGRLLADIDRQREQIRNLLA